MFDKTSFIEYGRIEWTVDSMGRYIGSISVVKHIQSGCHAVFIPVMTS